MNIERLNMMADLLDRIQADQVRSKLFNLANWYGPMTSDFENLVSGLEGPDSEKVFSRMQECGTSACACGWAALEQSFNDLNFYFDPKKGKIIYEVPEPHSQWSVLYGSWRAIEEFFEVSKYRAEDLFHPAGYLREGIAATDEDIQPKHVAERIRNYLAKEGQEAEEIAAALKEE